MGTKKTKKTIKKALKAKSRKEMKKYLRKALKSTYQDESSKHDFANRYNHRMLNPYFSRCVYRNDMSQYFGGDLPTDGILKYIMTKTRKKVVINIVTVDVLNEKSNINFTVDFDGDVGLEIDSLRNADLDVGMSVSSFGCIQKIIEALCNSDTIGRSMVIGTEYVTISAAIARALTYAAYRVKVGTPAPDAEYASIRADGTYASIENASETNDYIHAPNIKTINIYLKDDNDTVEDPDDECCCGKCTDECDCEVDDGEIIPPIIDVESNVDEEDENDTAASKPAVE